MKKTLQRLNPDVPTRPWYARKVRVSHVERMHRLRKRENMTIERLVDMVFELGLGALEGNGNATRTVLSPAKGVPGKKVLRRRAGKVKPVAPPDEEYPACKHCGTPTWHAALAIHESNCADYFADRAAEVTSPREGLSREDDDEG